VETDCRPLFLQKGEDPAAFTFIKILSITVSVSFASSLLLEVRRATTVLKNGGIYRRSASSSSDRLPGAPDTHDGSKKRNSWRRSRLWAISFSASSVLRKLVFVFTLSIQFDGLYAELTLISSKALPDVESFHTGWGGRRIRKVLKSIEGR
jgi:hypothetical protein